MPLPAFGLPPCHRNPASTEPDFPMTRIETVLATEILDSRGNPTVHAAVVLENGANGSASVPSGASTGSREAVELRDGDTQRYGGKGVLYAVANVRGELADAVRGLDAGDQESVDRTMLDADGTPNKARLGANALLAVSLAVLRASAASENVEVHQRIRELSGAHSPAELPVPMFNVLNGGAHASGSTDFQEFMIVPVGFESFSVALRAGTEIYRHLKEALEGDGLSTTVGDEGGFAPPGLTNRTAFTYITRAIESAGYAPGEDVFIALDPAATEFHESETGLYDLKREGSRLTTAEMIGEYEKLTGEFPIYSIEDGLAEDDWDGWAALTAKLGGRVQLVGDDLLVTQAEFLRRAIEDSAANAILIKLNQVGTVTETLETMSIAQASGFGTVISHRSGETADTTIADLAVGTNAGQIKAGAPARGERVAKYNRLLHIESKLSGKSAFAGRRVLPGV